ncbi:MAG: transcriptional repressor LexA [bacterium]
MTGKKIPAERGLTDRQSGILDFILATINKKGYPPSIREIGNAVGLSSSSTVHSHLKALEIKGFIRRDSSKPRTIEVTDHSPIVSPCVLLPLLEKGRETREKFPVPAAMLSDAPGFLVRMQGESMKEAAILDGDYVVARRQDRAEDGDLVVALVEEETIIRRYFGFRDYVRLEPENRRLTSILLREVTILGRVMGVLRQL